MPFAGGADSETDPGHSPNCPGDRVGKKDVMEQAGDQNSQERQPVTGTGLNPAVEITGPDAFAASRDRFEKVVGYLRAPDAVCDPVCEDTRECCPKCPEGQRSRTQPT